MYALSKPFGHYINGTHLILNLGQGTIYYISNDKIPYLEVEIDTNNWNSFNTVCFLNNIFVLVVAI